MNVSILEQRSSYIKAIYYKNVLVGPGLLCSLGSEACSRNQHGADQCEISGWLKVIPLPGRCPGPSRPQARAHTHKHTHTHTLRNKHVEDVEIQTHRYMDDFAYTHIGGPVCAHNDVQRGLVHTFVGFT